MLSSIWNCLISNKIKKLKILFMAVIIKLSRVTKSTIASIDHLLPHPNIKQELQNWIFHIIYQYSFMTFIKERNKQKSVKEIKKRYVFKSWLYWDFSSRMKFQLGSPSWNYCDYMGSFMPGWKLRKMKISENHFLNKWNFLFSFRDETKVTIIWRKMMLHPSS